MLRILKREVRSYFLFTGARNTVFLVEIIIVFDPKNYTFPEKSLFERKGIKQNGIILVYISKQDK